MNNIQIIISLIFLCTLTSCTKEESNRPYGGWTINCPNLEKPGNYFPAFPKSWWNYLDKNNDSVRYEISDIYEDCLGRCRPMFLNPNKCIEGKNLFISLPIGLGSFTVKESPIYSTIKDSILICPISFSTFKQVGYYLNQETLNYRRKATTVDTNITVDGINYINVLIIYEYDRYNLSHRYYDYFAKDIGLIKRDSVNLNDTTDLIEILSLQGYNIEN